jgi:hypothetical protein
LLQQTARLFLDFNALPAGRAASCVSPLLSLSFGVEEGMPLMPLVLTLVPADQSIPVGTFPILRLTVENVGGADERLVKPHGTLRDTFCELVITQGGRAVELPRAISDPGPICENDFLTLKPGESATFEFTRYAVGTPYLPPGEYQASLRYWQGPRLFMGAVMSPTVTLRVEPLKKSGVKGIK